jgi:hypothetical protein
MALGGSIALLLPEALLDAEALGAAVLFVADTEVFFFVISGDHP